MRFTKMHGAGNDYVYVDITKKPLRGDVATLARVVSDRRTGVGSDGLILMARSKKADFRMIMYNADGSEGEMCGNGIRCIAKYVVDHRLTSKRKLSIETKGGIVGIEVHPHRGPVTSVTVSMGTPHPIPSSFHVAGDGQRTLLSVPIEVEGRTFMGHIVSMGNPHCVIEVEDVANFPVSQFGPLIEQHPHFPSRVNVEFVHVLAANRVRQRTWERGSSETHACGSGACAVAFALKTMGRVDEHLSIELRGGTLDLHVAHNGEITMTGPAVEVFQGEWPTPARRGR